MSKDNVIFMCCSCLQKMERASDYHFYCDNNHAHNTIILFHNLKIKYYILTFVIDNELYNLYSDDEFKVTEIRCNNKTILEFNSYCDLIILENGVLDPFSITKRLLKLKAFS